MATLKHIASKNSDYTAIEAYLVYQHDEFSGKVILDEQSRPTLRESYLLDTLECGGFSFATACLLANRKYGKNTQHGDIKSHQYIISFDPKRCSRQRLDHGKGTGTWPEILRRTTSPVIPPSFALTPMGTTIRETSMSTS